MSRGCKHGGTHDGYSATRKPFADWHEISVTVTGNHYQSSVEGKVIFTGTTPLTCGGVFIRIWRSTVRLRDLTVTPI